MTNPPGQLRALSLEDCRKLLEDTVNAKPVRANSGLTHFNLSLLEHLKNAERWQTLMAYNAPDLYVLAGMSPEQIKSIVDQIVKER